jgi:hypothetical protein
MSLEDIRNEEFCNKACNNCGKDKPNILIINTDIFTLSEYLDFKENNEGLCIECFVGKKRTNKHDNKTNRVDDKL